MDKEIKVRIIDSVSNRESLVYLSEGENLLEALVRSGMATLNECGGIGICGKCVIRVIEGTLSTTPQDKDMFSESELSEGYRLACMAYPMTDCKVMLCTEINTGYKVVTETISNMVLSDEGYAIAIDIGTTTLAFALVNLSEGEIIERYSAVNPQRVYGSDVISRIKASNEGNLHRLSMLIRGELFTGFKSLLNKQRIELKTVKKIIISGNTTMIHLLMGYSCEGLGVYPFTPINTGIIYTFTDDLFATDIRVPIMILPGISVFVGGDITAGLLACGIDRAFKPCLFIDLGTNGEIALGNRERIMVTSTAAGPAFEGGNISSGVGSIPGAIYSVTIDEDNISYETIDDEPPLGLCGTGVIELVSELLKQEIIDTTGLLRDPYFDNGYKLAGINFSQKDIRELQMAKGAIRAGVEILINRFGISYEQLDRVYIAGGFGYHLNIDKAIHIGLLPNTLLNKTIAVGNTSLSGAILALGNNDILDRVEHLISFSEEIHLSNDEDFNDLFVRYMSFDS